MVELAIVVEERSVDIISETSDAAVVKLIVLGVDSGIHGDAACCQGLCC